MTENWLLILGANSDIALATAHEFASNDWNILLCSRNIENIEKSAADIEIRYNVQTCGLYFDAEDFDSHKAFFANLPNQPAGVLLAFGYLGNQQLAQMDFVEAKRIIDVNYLGAVSILEVVADSLEIKKQGFIAGISSVAGDRGRASNYIYGSAKGAFSTYLGGLRHRLFSSNVHVLTVKPGFVASKMTSELNLPKSLTASPEQVAKIIYSSVMKRKNVVYVKPIWQLIMVIIQLLPEIIFKRTKL